LKILCDDLAKIFPFAWTKPKDWQFVITQIINNTLNICWFTKRISNSTVTVLHMKDDKYIVYDDGIPEISVSVYTGLLRDLFDEIGYQ
jgi:hypothetical protein